MLGCSVGGGMVVAAATICGHRPPSPLPLRGRHWLSSTPMGRAWPRWSPRFVSFFPWSSSSSSKEMRRCGKAGFAAQAGEPAGALQNNGAAGVAGGGGEGSRLLTLPTVLTLGRVAAVPLLVGTITDWLDGYLARKMRLGTPFGAFLDPVADKLMVAATLVLLCTRPLEVPAFSPSPWLLTVPAIAIIGREITMSAVREWAASQNAKLLEAVAVNNLGKWKTATQMTALTILLATRDNSLSGSEVLVGSGVVLLYVSAGLGLWSLAVYMRKIWRVLLK